LLPDVTKSAIVGFMDALAADDLETSRRTSPEEKLVMALEMAEAGIRLKRATLRQALPDATEEDVEAALERWLLTDA
jgi:hypothetical protein